MIFLLSIFGFFLMIAFSRFSPYLSSENWGELSLGRQSSFDF